MPHITKPLPFMGRFHLSRFDESYAAGNFNDCWEWQGYRNESGYGVLTVSRRQVLAHRISYALEHGRDPGNYLVCHTCDNRLCVNPAHLWLGSNAENVIDGVLKRQGVRGGILSFLGKRPYSHSTNPGMPCVRCGHIRTDDYISKYKDGRPYGRCRQCVTQRDYRRTAARRAARKAV